MSGTKFAAGEVERQLFEFVAQKFGVTAAEVREVPMEEIGIDSLGVVQLEMRLRKLFGVVVPDEALDAQKSLDEVIELTVRLLAGVDDESP